MLIYLFIFLFGVRVVVKLLNNEMNMLLWIHLHKLSTYCRHENVMILNLLSLLMERLECDCIIIYPLFVVAHQSISAGSLTGLKKREEK